MNQPVNYLQPDVPGNLPWHKVKTIVATNESLKGSGCLVKASEYKIFPVEIVQWPKVGGRPIDADTGNQAGTKEGVFDFWWEGDLLFGRNNAVKDEYLLGWSVNPDDADRNNNVEANDKVLLWHANYHPRQKAAICLRKKLMPLKISSCINLLVSLGNRHYELNRRVNR